MQNFSYKFHSLRFLLNETSNIYHSYQILISDSPRSRLPGSLLQTQGTSRYCATFLSQISFLPLSIKSDIINIYYSYQNLISDSFRSRLTGSLLQTQGTSRYYATFLSQISFFPLLVTIGIECTSFISNPLIKILQIKAFRVTTSNSGNFRVICNISLTNFVPSAFNKFRHHKYISFISNPHIRFLQIKAYRVTTSNSGNFKVLCNIPLTNFVPSTSSHNRHRMYIIHIESSYQNPPDQGFCGHYFKRRELQGIMQHFSHKFHSCRFKLH